MRKILSLILVIALFANVMAFAGGKKEDSAANDADKIYSIGGGSSGGVYYAMANVFMQFFNKHELGNFSVLPTTGSGQNLLFMKNKEIDVAVVSAGVALDAANGQASFKDKPYDEARAITFLYAAYFQQLVRSGAGIDSFNDLKGKKLVIGGPGSGDVANAERIYGAFGMTFDDFKPEYVGTNEGIEQIKDAHADGAIALTPLPFSAFIELTSAKKAKIIPVPKDTIDKLTQGKTAKYFPAVIPAGTYKNQDKELATIANATTFLTREDVDEELVYNITKTIWEELDDLKSYHAAIKNLESKDALNGLTVPLHEGAARYYKEIGLIK